MSARSHTRRPHRRGMAVAASAAVVCLGTLLAACGGGASGDGYVAVGAAGPGPSGRVESVEPTEGVEFVPLDEDGNGDGAGDGDRNPPSGSPSEDASEADSGSSPGNSAAGGAAAGGPGPGTGGSEGESPGTGTTSGGSDSDSGSGSGGTGGSDSDSGGTSDSLGSTPGTGTPAAGPAELEILGEPVLAAADDRWCQKVTVEFHNSGGTAVRSGEVTFGTHIIGGLGVDWATIESTQDLTAPIEPGAKKKQTFTVCVDAWRVPLGMHIETQDVAVTWK